MIECMFTFLLDNCKAEIERKEMIEIEKIRRRYCVYVKYWDNEMCGDLKPKKSTDKEYFK